MVEMRQHDATMSFDSTEDEFEKFAREGVKDPRNKDMLGISEDAMPPGVHPPEAAERTVPQRPSAPEPNSGPAPWPRKSSTSQEGSEEKDVPEPENIKGAPATHEYPDSAPAPVDYNSNAGRYDDSGVESDLENEKLAVGLSPRNSAANLYTSPYRPNSAYSPVQSRHGKSPERAPTENSAGNNDERQEYIPGISRSPRESAHGPRRPFSAGSRSWVHRSAEAASAVSSDRLSSPGYQGQRVRRVLREMMQRDPRTWDPMEVRYWLDFVGLSQHRYKFGAHAVDGKTLLKLSDEYLKYEVGIQAIGHRQQILECIEDLKAGLDLEKEPKVRTGRARPTSAPPVRDEAARGGALGAMSIQEQYQKLSKELDKAVLRAEHHARLAEEATRLANLAAEEVRNVQKQLNSVTKAAKKQGMDVRINAKGEEIWRPVGKGMPQSAWAPSDPYERDNVLPDKHTKPKINKKSKQLMAERDKSMPVWEKAQQDVQRMEGKIKEKRRQLEEAMAGPENTSEQRMKRNREYVTTYFQEHFMIDVPKDARETMAVIEQTLDAFADQITKDEKELEALRKLKNTALVDALANVLRTKNFLGRLDGTIRNHESNLETLKATHHKNSVKEEEHVRMARGQAALYSSLGWVAGSGEGDTEEGVTLARLNALLKRARIFKILDEENDQGIQDSVDSDPRLQDISMDGLKQLEERSGKEGALEDAINMLKHAMHEDLGMAMRIKGLNKKSAAVFKIYRTQKHYLTSTLPDLQKREEALHKLERGEGLDQTEGVPTAPPGKYNGFMERLEEDMEKRAARKEEWLKQGTHLSPIEAQIQKVSNIKRDSALFDDSQRESANEAGAAKSVVSFKTTKSLKTPSPTKTATRYA